MPALLVDEDHPNGLVFADDYTGGGLLVRYHNKIDRSGDLDGDYSEIIDGIDRLIFLDSNVADVSAALVENGEAALVLSRGAQITIPAYKGLTFSLDTKQPPDGQVRGPRAIDLVHAFQLSTGGRLGRPLYGLLDVVLLAGCPEANDAAHDSHQQAHDDEGNRHAAREADGLVSHEPAPKHEAEQAERQDEYQGFCLLALEIQLEGLPKG